jgi:REP element-mobilizing transposase RayT
MRLINRAYKAEIHAFVLMSNHFHLVVSFPENNMSEAMNYFMRETSRMISRDAGRINQTYGSRYFRSIIEKGATENLFIIWKLIDFE